MEQSIAPQTPTPPDPPKYRPRHKSQGWDIYARSHGLRAKLLGEYVDPATGRVVNMLPDNWRLWLQDRYLSGLKSCSHTTRTLVEVENEYGVWGVEICNNCGHLVEGPQCPHVSNTWHADGQVLLCDNCGIDGT